MAKLSVFNEDNASQDFTVMDLRTFNLKAEGITP